MNTLTPYEQQVHDWCKAATYPNTFRVTHFLQEDGRIYKTKTTASSLMGWLDWKAKAYIPFAEIVYFEGIHPVPEDM